jgi:hypothetical protein
MNNRQRQIVAEKIGSTVRVLELLGLEYTVHNPRRPNPKGNKSPRVVTVRYGNDREMRVYNGMDGSTWAHHSITRTANLSPGFRASRIYMPI